MDLIISEKHNAAQRIAEILSDGTASRQTVSGTPVYEWGDKQSIGLAGHVVELDFTDGYNDWNNVPPSALIDAELDTQPSKPGIVSAVKTLAKNADRVIIATDYDREGELIGKEAHDLAQEANSGIQVDRVRFSSLTAPAIREAFQDPVEIDFNLAAAGEARQIIDLRWGAALTRFLTLAASRGDGVISVGRVQTPTLKLLVDREREIEGFDPDDYWEIVAELCEPPHGTPFEAQYFYLDEDDNEAERLWEESKAKATYSNINGAFKATVTDVSESTRNDNPPVPFSTTEFIKAANAIGFDAKPAMSIAEDLYDNGFITYPRTDNTVYPEEMDARELLSTLALRSSFEEDAKALLENDELEATEGDSETTDHPPIHPTQDMPPSGELSDSEWRIYELVVRRFFATFAEPAVWKRSRIDADADGHSLKANGKRLVEPGYHDVYPYYDTDETSVPAVSEGDMLQISDVELQEKQTQPPNRYGQSQLIEKMESLGVGTKSTRHNTIDKLYDRDYVKSNPPEPTPLAIALIEAVEEYSPQVGTADMTSELEGDMTAIAEADTTLDTVTSESCSMLRDVFDDLEGAEAEIRDAMKDHLGDGDTATEDDSVGDCPECGEWLLPREAKSGSKFVGCNGYPECEFTLPLPNKGKVHLLDDVCSDHDLHKVKMIAGKKTHVFGCPQCKKEESEESDDRVIGECPDCSTGELAIKRVQTGSRLVGCTDYPDCDYSLPLPKNGELEVTDEMCADHNLPEVVIHQEDSSSPWELGCPICNYENYQG
jgi:DNA topoisomerase-1